MENQPLPPIRACVSRGIKVSEKFRDDPVKYHREYCRLYQAHMRQYPVVRERHRRSEYVRYHVRKLVGDAVPSQELLDQINRQYDTLNEKRATMTNADSAQTDQ